MARFSLKSAGAKAFVEASQVCLPFLAQLRQLNIDGSLHPIPQRQSVHHEQTLSAVWSQLSQGLAGGTQVYDNLILSAKSGMLDFKKVVHQSYNSRKTQKKEEGCRWERPWERSLKRGRRRFGRDR
jgi:hypothetical protein